MNLEFISGRSLATDISELDENISLTDLENEFFKAVRYGRLKKVKDFIDSQLINDIDIKTKEKYTALMLAVESFSDDIVIYLINRGAEVNYKAPDGHSAISLAVNYRQIKIVRILLDKGASLDFDFTHESRDQLKNRLNPSIAEHRFYRDIDEDNSMNGDNPSRVLWNVTSRPIKDLTDLKDLAFCLAVDEFECETEYLCSKCSYSDPTQLSLATLCKIISNVGFENHVIDSLISHISELRVLETRSLNQSVNCCYSCLQNCKRIFALSITSEKLSNDRDIASNKRLAEYNLISDAGDNKRKLVIRVKNDGILFLYILQESEDKRFIEIGSFALFSKVPLLMHATFYFPVEYIFMMNGIPHLPALQNLYKDYALSRFDILRLCLVLFMTQEKWIARDDNQCLDKYVFRRDTAINKKKFCIFLTQLVEAFISAGINIYSAEVGGSSFLGEIIMCMFRDYRMSDEMCSVLLSLIVPLSVRYNFDASMQLFDDNFSRKRKSLMQISKVVIPAAQYGKYISIQTICKSLSIQPYSLEDLGHCPYCAYDNEFILPIDDECKSVCLMLTLMSEYRNGYRNLDELPLKNCFRFYCLSISGSIRCQKHDEFWKQFVNNFGFSDEYIFNRIQVLENHQTSAIMLFRDERKRTVLHMLAIFSVADRFADLHVSDLMPCLEAACSGCAKELNKAYYCETSTTALLKAQDHYGRTALHYAVMRDDSRILTELLDAIHIFNCEVIINVKDNFGATVLNYAAAKINSAEKDSNFEILLKRTSTMKTALTIFEGATLNYGKLPCPTKAMKARIVDLKAASLLPEINQRGLKRDISIYYACNCVPQKPMDEDNNITLYRHSCQNCDKFEWIAVNDETLDEKISVRHWKLSSGDNCSFYSIETIFNDLKKIIRTVNDSIDDVQGHLYDFMSRLARHISKKDALFKCHVLLLGSSKEKTKIPPVCEFDFNFVCDNFEKTCEAISAPACPSGFAYLKHKVNFSSKSTRKYFDPQSKNLQVKEFKSEFYNLLKMCLQQSLFWEEETYFELTRTGERDILLHSEQGCCFTLHLQMIPLKKVKVVVTIDIVPVIHIQNYFPADSPFYSRTLTKAGCHMVLDEPHKIHHWLPKVVTGKAHARITFAAAETSIIEKLPASVKAAFTLLKCFKKEYAGENRYSAFEHYISVSSHVVKTAVLFSAASEVSCRKRRIHRSTLSINDVSKYQVEYWMQKIFHCLIRFHHIGYQPSFFMSKLCRPVSDSERYLREHSEFVNSICTVKATDAIQSIRKWLKQRTNNSDGDYSFIFLQSPINLADFSTNDGSDRPLANIRLVGEHSGKLNRELHIAESENILFEYFNASEFLRVLNLVHPTAVLRIGEPHSI